MLLVAGYWRTNLTTRQLAPLFSSSQSAVERIIDHLGPSLALQPRKRFRKDTVLIVEAPGTHPRPHHRRAVQELSVLHKPPDRHRRRHPARRGGRPTPAGQPQRLQGVEGVRREGCRRQDHEDRRRRLSGHRARDALPPPQRRRTARLETGPQQVPQADPRPRTSSSADDWRSASVPAGTSRKSGAYGIELGGSAATGSKRPARCSSDCCRRRRPSRSKAVATN